MKRWMRELLVLVTVVLFLFIFYGVLVGDVTFGATENVFNWTQEGTSPFWKTPLKSEGDLKALFNNDVFKSKLAKRLQAAEPNWNGTEVVKLIEAAVRNSQFERVVIAPRTEEAEFDWMLYGAAGKTEATLWAGNHELKGYLVSFEYKDENQNILFGNSCVNVLKKRKKAELPLGEYSVKPSPRAEVPRSVVPVSVPDEGEIFIRVFFLRLPSGGPDRDALKNDPESWKTLNEAVKKTALEGRFLFKLYAGEVEGPASYTTEVRTADGVGIFSLSRDFLQKFKTYGIWPEKEVILRYRFFWPPSGWQKGKVEEFLKRPMNHRTFLTE